MKIVYIVPGFGGTFYCGNCLRDSGIVESLKKAGHDAVTLPMYLPLTMNGQTGENGLPVFYGAVNIYLKQYPVFRHMPRWFENLMNSPSVLKFAAKKSGSTRASGLEDLTESMLMGAEGHQGGELQQLVDFLKYHEKPDVVHVSNVLLLGLAKKFREELNIPVVYSLQDEDVWVDAMHPERRAKMWQLLAEKAKDVDAFIAVSNYFAKVMQQKLSLPDEKLHVLSVGVKPDAYVYSKPASQPQALGYLSRINDENGFEILVDAFILLKQNPAFANLKLIATGGSTGDDTRFINKQINKFKQLNIAGDFEIQPNFNQEVLIDFFKKITVLSVPVLKGEALGLYQLEALASGVPLVQPALGAFPEIIQATAGGVIYKPNTAQALADKLAELLPDTAKLETMSLAGRKAIEKDFNCGILSGKMIDIYKTIQLQTRIE
jgi:glycosyltransferase involved in cell wall biosynthesis